MANVYHTPALLIPCMEGLQIQKNGIYVDVTFGGGGHSREILNRLGEKGRLIAFDQDLDALQNVIPDKRFTFVRSNFIISMRLRGDSLSDLMVRLICG